MSLMSSLKPLEVQRCGACEWDYKGSRGWGCGKAVVALEWLWSMAHRRVQQWDVLVVSLIGASLTHAFLQTCIHRGAYYPESTARK